MTVLRLRAPLVFRCISVLALCLCIWHAAMAEDSGATDRIAAGERIYRDGILPSGQVLQGTIGVDVVMRGARAACVNCHRRSGYGGAEGDRIVPPIVGRYLFGDTGARTTKSALGAAAYYDAASFVRVLREGITHTGQQLRAPMPRFALSERDADALVQYLRSLSKPAPGVDGAEIHFATIVTDTVPEHQRAALLDVLNAFITAQNAERRANPSKVQRSPLGHTRAYRATQQWRLHVWTLSGPPQDWRAQIDRYYRAQPVFAVLGGAIRTNADKVQAQCERLQLPWLFPNVDAIDPRPADYFSMYFTRGVIQEAEILAETWRQSPASAPRRIVQVYRAHDSGAAAANALRHALAGIPQSQIENQVVAADAPASAFWAALPHDTDALVLWLRESDLVSLPPTLDSRAQIYLSDTLTATHAVPAALRARTSVLRLRELPYAWEDRRRRVELWLRSHGLSPADERIQGNTYVMLTLISRILTHMRENISREYLIEQIEHEAQTAAWASIYPQLSLASGQRIASRGGYRVSLRDDGSLPATAPWIIPGLGNRTMTETVTPVACDRC